MKSLCGGSLTLDKVMQALKQLYGGDHRAERKDQRRATQRAGAKPTETYFGEDFVEEYEYYDEEED